jgi:hypothetical protein
MTALSMAAADVVPVTTNSASTQYGNNGACSLSVSAPLGYVLGMHFLSFATEAGLDFFSAKDGVLTSPAALLLAPSFPDGRATGVGIAIGDLLSLRRSVVLAFTSDAANVNTGVTLQLAPVPQLDMCGGPTGGSNGAWPAGVLTDGGTAGLSFNLAANRTLSLSTNAAPSYLASASCSTTIVAPAGFVLGVVVMAAATLPGDTLTLTDAVTGDVLGPAIGGTSYSIGTTMSTTSTTLRLAFTSGSGVPLNAATTGVQLLVSAVPLRDICGTPAFTLGSGPSTAPAAGTALNLTLSLVRPSYALPLAFIVPSAVAKRCAVVITAPPGTFPAIHFALLYAGAGRSVSVNVTEGAMLLLRSFEGLPSPGQPQDIVGSAPGGTITLSVAFGGGGLAGGTFGVFTVGALRPHDMCAFGVSSSVSSLTIAPQQAVPVTTNVGAAYRSNAACTLIATAPLGYVLALHTEPGMAVDATDSFTLLDAASSAALLTYSGASAIATDVLSSSANGTIKFVTDANSVSAGVRFLLFAVPLASVCGGAARLDLAAGQAVPLSTQTADAYSPNAACSKLLVAPAGYATAITLSAIALADAGDTFKVFDGPTTTASLLLPPITYDGALPPVGSYSLYASSGTSLTLSFASNALGVAAGVQLIATAVPVIDMCGSGTGAAAPGVTLSAANLAQLSIAAGALTMSRSFGWAVGSQTLMAAVSTGRGSTSRASPCNIALTPPPGMILAVHTTTFSPQATGDTLLAVDASGILGAAVPLGALPADAFSSSRGGTATLRFFSSSGVQASPGAGGLGARITVSAVRPRPICAALGGPRNRVFLPRGSASALVITNDAAYGNNARCAMELLTTTDCVFNITFVTFQTEATLDVLSIVDGGPVAGSPVAYSGSGLLVAVPAPVLTRTNNASVTFVSSASIGYAGVRLSVAVSCGAQPSSATPSTSASATGLASRTSSSSASITATHSGGPPPTHTATAPPGTSQVPTSTAASTTTALSSASSETTATATSSSATSDTATATGTSRPTETATASAAPPQASVDASPSPPEGATATPPLVSSVIVGSSASAAMASFAIIVGAILAAALVGTLVVFRLKRYKRYARGKWSRGRKTPLKARAAGDDPFSMLEPVHVATHKSPWGRR